ncbi:hypothetical protein FRACYDRAFT_267999 [Fragilariopsis cylindrus CCMP1102]|uniref:Uncharacterized protein n=1 Tax=Fragilariopsis cylindrus CCMP1102 TaxID=635003 RepID=A0A1E7FMI3_9STRA|nr:hypothetical protein FRACYDRAFT_267999 [Fragilariopsis cylindrus CCMP1102]|eukprot:OEU19334.1 hypothetical protein FRACYDRAFT_267999 [Fragilariopsis cylindrus CCMP1102]
MTVITPVVVIVIMTIVVVVFEEFCLQRWGCILINKDPIDTIYLCLIRAVAINVFLGKQCDFNLDLVQN